MRKAGGAAVRSGRIGMQYAAPLAVGGGMMIGTRIGVTAGMTTLGVTGLLPLMATTALACGIVGAGMYWAMEWVRARKNGTNPPKILSRARLGQGLNTAANVATVGIFGLAKSAFQAASQRSFKTLFDWRDPASYLKLGVYAGAAYAGFNLYDAHQDQIADVTRDLRVIDYGEDIQPALESGTRTATQAFDQLGDTFNEAVAYLNEVMAYDEGVTVEIPPEPEAPANSGEMSSVMETAGEQVGIDSPAYLQDALNRAESGNPQGMKDLAQAYLTGQHGAEQDTQLATKLYESAADAGNEQARQDLATIDRLGIDYFERQPLIQEAQQHLKGIESQYLRDTLESAESGNPQGLKDLGHALLHGKDGAQQDTELAYKLYERAAAAGNEQALTDLAYIDKVGLDHFEQNFGGNMAEPPPKPSANPEIPTKVAECTYAMIENDNRSGFRIGCDFNSGSWLNSNSYAHVLIGGDQHKIGVQPPERDGVFAVSDIDDRVKEDILKGQIASRAHEIALNAKQAKPT
jgi:TPR repeat protein